MIHLTRFRLFILMVAANLAVAGGLVTGEAHACSCAGIPSPAEGLRNSDAVFWGEVVSKGTLKVESQEATMVSGPYLDPITFDVVEIWKGVSNEPVMVYGQGDEVSCGLNFEKGKSYLVYAYHSGGDSVLETNFCTATTPLTDAKDAPQGLGSPTGELPDTGGPGWSRPSVFAVFGALAVALSVGVIAARRKV